MLFGEVADKSVPQPFKADEGAYEQVVTRFEAWLGRNDAEGVVAYGLSEAVVDRFMYLMARFQRWGMWRRLDHVAGHPFFVGSHTSEMIQIADVIAYVLRRSCEKNETDVLVRLMPRFDRLGKALVGLRHFRGGRRCRCTICMEPRTPRRRGSRGRRTRLRRSSPAKSAAPTATSPN